MRWTKLAIAWSASLAVTALMAPQSAPAAPASDLAAALAMPFASDLVGASDAPRFAWVEDVAGVRNVWVGGPDLPARALTNFAEDDGLEIYGLALSQDGTHLAFVRGGDAEFPAGTIPNADHRAKPPLQQLFMAEVKGGKPRLIGTGYAPVFARGGTMAFIHKHDIMLMRPGGKAHTVVTAEGEISNLSWSPDGQKLLFVDSRGDHSFAALYTPGHGHDNEPGHVRYLAPGLSYAADPVFSPDGTRAAFIQFLDPPAGGDPDDASYWAIMVADTQSGDTHTLWKAPRGPGGQYAGTRQQNLHWTADGRLQFPWERDGWLHVYSVDTRKPAAAPQELTPGAFEVETFLLGADRRTLLYVGNPGQSDVHTVWQVPPGAAPSRITSSTAIESYPALAGSALAVIAADAVHPAHVMLAVGSGTELGPNPALEDAVIPRPVVFTAQDGVTVHGQLFAGKGTGPHPALVFVHGGPRRQMLLGFNAMGYYSNAYILNQHLADQGLTVLSVNYRSGTGYGHAFREAPGIARDGASEYRDVLAAGRWLAAQKGQVDPQRIGIWGEAGAATSPRWRWRATATCSLREPIFTASTRCCAQCLTAFRPRRSKRHMTCNGQSSPFGAMDTWRSPVLIVHGDDDHNVDFSQSVLLARELTARGITHEELVFPNERHGFLRYADWLASYRATVQFMDRHLLHTAATATRSAAGPARENAK